MPDSNNKDSPPQLPTGRRREYISSANPGSRLPHMYVRVNPLSEVCININMYITIILVTKPVQTCLT